jgi:class 3 adenylate cyclase
MSVYDYREGKKRVTEILDNPNDVTEEDPLPSKESSHFTYDNAYRSWITSIFVDIRNSTDLFTENKATTVAKIARAFSSEIIEILRDDENLRDIGIRGDCVFAVYATRSQSDIYEVFGKAMNINVFLRMLNKTLESKQFPTFLAGIGLSCSKDLVVKAGRAQTGVSDLVFIGESATYASKFAGMGNKNGLRTMVMSDLFYNNIIDQLGKNAIGKDPKSWFRKNYDCNLSYYYDADVIDAGFSKWVEGGMTD